MINDENGRSMVEMLGVLAIIGVLSVAGISGYSMAMRKLKANDIIDLASKLRIVTMANADGAGAGYPDATAAAIGSLPTGVNLCSHDEGDVKYTIDDENLRKVVSANAPSWLCDAGADTSCDTKCP